jgi:hypothetical protein
MASMFYGSWADAVGTSSGGIGQPDADAIGTADYIVQGTTVRLRGAAKRTAGGAFSGPDTVLVLPEAVAPAQETRFTALYLNGSSPNFVLVYGIIKHISGYGTLIAIDQTVDNAQLLSSHTTSDRLFLDEISWDMTP